MDYDEFKAAFLAALRGSGLPPIGAERGEEILHLRSTDRTLTVHVEPSGRQIGGPFHVTGSVSWRWDALQTARTRSTEEDLLAELLGRDESTDLDTDQPFLRVDIEIRAGLDYGKSMPLPPPNAWAAWSREAIGRLQNVERLVTDDVTRETPGGQQAILAWQGDPEIEATCTPEGEIRLQAITVRAFQGIDLPRKWDDPEREPDEGPHDDLAALFRRLKMALYAWGEVMDHLA